MPEQAIPIIVIGPAPDLRPVWCDKAQADCWEQPLPRIEGAPVQPCRWCQDPSA